MDAQKRREAAVRDLERHQERMIRLWSDDYKSDPRYELAVEEVANKARAPNYVLADFEGR